MNNAKKYLYYIEKYLSIYFSNMVLSFYKKGNYEKEIE